MSAAQYIARPDRVFWRQQQPDGDTPFPVGECHGHAPRARIVPDVRPECQPMNDTVLPMTRDLDGCATGVVKREVVEAP